MTTTKVQPATGNAEWAGTAPNGFRLLRIEVQTAAGPVVTLHEVEPAGGDRYTLHGVNLGTGEFSRYAVTLGDRPACTCGDATHRRPGACKHVRGLAAALKRRPYHGYAG